MTTKKGMLKGKKKIEGKNLNVQSAEEQEGKSGKGKGVGIVWNSFGRVKIF